MSKITAETRNDGSPVRKIGPNYVSITGHLPSLKKPGLVAFESQLERDLAMLLEFDPRVRTFVEQPVRLRCGRHRYTPDFRVLYHSGEHLAPVLIEVKARRELFRNWKRHHPRLLIGSRYARETEHAFKIVTEHEIPPLRLRNIKKLWRYRSEQIPHEEIEQVLLALREFERTTPGELLEFLTLEPAEREALLVAVWHLVAVQSISTDLDGSELTMSSFIWGSEGSQVALA